MGEGRAGLVFGGWGGDGALVRNEGKRLTDTLKTSNYTGGKHHKRVSFLNHLHTMLDRLYFEYFIFVLDCIIFQR